MKKKNIFLLKLVQYVWLTSEARPLQWHNAVYLHIQYSLCFCQGLRNEDYPLQDIWPPHNSYSLTNLSEWSLLGGGMKTDT